MSILPYGPEWRLQRKLAAHALSATAVVKYRSIQADLSAILCKDLIETPETLFEHVRRISGRIIMIITYGIGLKEADEHVSLFLELDER